MEKSVILKLLEIDSTREAFGMDDERKRERLLRFHTRVRFSGIGRRQVDFLADDEMSAAVCACISRKYLPGSTVIRWRSKEAIGLDRDFLALHSFFRFGVEIEGSSLALARLRTRPEMRRRGVLHSVMARPRNPSLVPL